MAWAKNSTLALELAPLKGKARFITLMGTHNRKKYNIDTDHQPHPLAVFYKHTINGFAHGGRGYMRGGPMMGYGPLGGGYCRK